MRSIGDLNNNILTAIQLEKRKMRQVTDIKRTKQTFNVTVDEIKEGKWIKHIPDADIIELDYKNGWLTIRSAKIRKLVKLKESEKEEIKNGRDARKPAE